MISRIFVAPSIATITLMAMGLLLTPVTVSPSSGLMQNDACAAGGACAPEVGSLCETDDGVLEHYSVRVE